MSEVKNKGKLAKEASYLLASKSTEEKNHALELIAKQLIEDEAEILQANQLDLSEGKKANLTDAVLDRIMLDGKRIKDISQAVIDLTHLTDPIGEVFETVEKDNGLLIEKTRVPIGVIGMIYEARPNVTIDAATLSLKTGNAVVLRGSSSAIHSNKALIASLHKALEKSDIPTEAFQLIEDTSRETAKEFFKLNEYLDVLIPRGSANLIQVVLKEATVPVIETGAGNCHVYLDESAQKEMAIDIVKNAKLQRPSVCNAIETILIHPEAYNRFGETLLTELTEQGVKIHADETIHAKFTDSILATEEDWYQEYLGNEVSVKLVNDYQKAIGHINKYGTGHSEAIVTENDSHAKAFLQGVDASSVYHNASTRFTDGGEFGYGAEMGISTQKIHARGPMGLQALTSSKFIIKGQGQIRH
ncbi:MAG TPA: glutamate-5-semialdehyde dehydrogenase [Pseudogracilibacillus sp.]|nr:glutamate-5-semialdehyde dehydrogenase [Pseudogracilibacillus sp.]